VIFRQPNTLDLSDRQLASVSTPNLAEHLAASSQLIPQWAEEPAAAIAQLRELRVIIFANDHLRTLPAESLRHRHENRQRKEN